MSSESQLADQENKPHREVAIRISGLTKTYPLEAPTGTRLKRMLSPAQSGSAYSHTALSEFDLEVFRGETVGIVGRNGSGKSTLLNLVCGTLRKSAGRLEVNGHLAPLLALGAGFDPEFTGRENALMNAAIIGMKKGEIKESLESIIEFAGIGDFFDQKVKTYSSGMYARLAFSVAIHAQPEILVIDEILSVGDDAFARKCHTRLAELKESGSTILFVSHSAQLVVDLCDRAVLLEGGSRLLTDRPKEVVNYYHRLIYSSPESREALIAEIREFDEVGPLHRPQSDEDTEAGRPAQKSGRFDPELQSESRSEYEQLGAVIRNPVVRNESGEEVNVLDRGGEYTYTYEVSFSEDAYGVQFGMMIKTAAGVELSGQISHSQKQRIEKVPGHQTLRVGFSFRANLSAGTYFINAGVMGIRQGEVAYLHRVLDAIAFRVEAIEDDRLTGRVDLSTASPWTQEETGL
ncbi:ABC transporter ATP-binding protein [Myxococcota bacterium]|nr:ABC transporter ATP-binding protein [Myxococcota bacterium]